MINANITITFSEGDCMLDIERESGDEMMNIFNDNLQYEISVMYNNLIASFRDNWLLTINIRNKTLPNVNLTEIISTKFKNVLINNGWEIEKSTLNAINGDSVLFLKCMYFDDNDIYINDDSFDIVLNSENDFCI